MRFFNETAPYWGHEIPKIIGHADERLTVRSVKIFTDGESWLQFTARDHDLTISTGALRSGGAAVSSTL